MVTIENGDGPTKHLCWSYICECSQHTLPGSGLHSFCTNRKKHILVMLRTTQIGCRAYVVKHKFKTHKNIEQVMDYLEVNKCNGYNCFMRRFHVCAHVYSSCAHTCSYIVHLLCFFSVNIKQSSNLTELGTSKLQVFFWRHLLVEQGRPNIRPNIEPNIGPNIEPNIRQNIKPNIGPNFRLIIKPNIEPNNEPNIRLYNEPNIGPKI